MPLSESPSLLAACRRSAAIWLLAGCCGWVSGCGVEAYEQRLTNANEMFAYQNRLDRVLDTTPWAAPGGFDVKLRVPKEYTQILPPAPPAAS